MWREESQGVSIHPRLFLSPGRLHCKNRPNTVFLEPEDVANDSVVVVCGVEKHSAPSDNVCIVCRG